MGAERPPADTLQLIILGGRQGRGQALLRGLIFVWEVEEGQVRGRGGMLQGSSRLWAALGCLGGDGEGEGSSCKSCLWMASTRGRSCCQLALDRRWSYACDTGGTTHAGMPQTGSFPGVLQSLPGMWKCLGAWYEVGVEDLTSNWL